MTIRIPGSLAVAIAAVGLATVLVPADAGGGEATRANSVRIGMVGTLFRDTPVALLQPMMTPFKTLMEAQTGCTGEMVVAGDCEELCKQLEEKQADLGVFNGFEYAWARQKYAKLKPLVIAINKYRHLEALVVVHRQSTVGGLPDLRGKTVALPRFSREHCRLFLERRCQEQGQSPCEFFTELTKPQDAEEALDQVVKGKIQAAVVDRQSLELYQRLKPGWFGELKTAQQSEPFPATVVTYQEGAIDEAVLKRFRDGLIKANQTVGGQRVLGMCRMTGFEAIPADYDKTLNAILKAYPPPSPSCK